MWAGQRSYELLGTPFECEGEEAASEVERLLGSFPSTRRAARGRHRFTLVSAARRHHGLHCGEVDADSACLAVGFAHLSDEALCVSYDTGLALPYFQTPRLDRWSAEVLGVRGLGGWEEAEIMVSPAELGPLAAEEETPLRHVVLVERRPGPPLLEPTPRSEAMAALLRISFNHYKRPTPAVHLAARLANGAGAWTLAFGDPLAATLLHRQLG